MKIIAFTLSLLIWTQSDAQNVDHLNGRYIDWKPYSWAKEYVALAAITPSRTPVVLYDPVAIREIDVSARRFLLLREEYVALIATSDRLKTPKPESSLAQYSSVSVFYEEHVLSRIGISIEKTSDILNCLAYDSLTSSEKEAFAAYIQRETTMGKKVLMGNGMKPFNREDFKRLQGPECSDTRRKLDAELGFN